ncbi:threonine synthase [Myroides sp. LJL115]
MKYYSLNNPDIQASFKEAVLLGLAKDKGLFFPQSIPSLDKDFIDNIEQYSNEQIALKVIQPFVGKDIDQDTLEQIVAQTLSFPLPVKPVDPKCHTLELFHGPTLAFKDVGAGFMSRCLKHFVKDSKQKIRVLVATSGDTGGAIAHGFYKQKGVEVIILYPKAKVSDLQEKQLTTLGHNITALEVEGDFDLCQTMVKKAFLDPEFQDLNLTSANSINISRWLSQMFYYFIMYKELKQVNKPLVVSVPSGNFGNICAGLLAKKMGLPIDHFVASTNANNTITRYLEDGQYKPNPTQPTISNAMDVSDPSNWIRVMELFEKQDIEVKSSVSAYSFSDLQTKQKIKEHYQKTGQILDPHSAVAFLGLEKFQKSNKDYHGVFLQTAHPIKFDNVINECLNIEVEIPQELQKLYENPKIATPISSYQDLKDILLK